MRNPFARRDNADDEQPAPADAGENLDGDEEGAGGERPADAPPIPAPRHHRGGPVSATFTLRDLLVVTYAVPAERVRPHVPADLPLDMLPGPDGERLAFLQTLCAFHADARWSLLPEGVGQSFHQVTQRVLVRRESRRGTFLLRAFVGSDEAHTAQRAVNRNAEFARFSVYIAGDPARATYQRYSVRAVADQAQAQLDVRLPSTTDEGTPPLPFATLTEAAAFLVDRPDTYFRASAPRTGIGLQPWRYGPLPDPLVGEVTAARNTLWTGLPLALLTPEDLLKPYATLLFPSVLVTSGAPRYARFK